MSLNRLAIGMFLLLAVEFILGMTLGLFVTLPSGAGLVSILTSSVVLDVHILVALFIIGISIRALILSLGAESRTPLYASMLALGSAVIATLAGWVFAFDGQHPDASFVMAFGFLGVLMAAFILRGYPGGRDGTPIPRRPRWAPPAEPGEATPDPSS
jgi:hypothetical protein